MQYKYKRVGVIRMRDQSMVLKTFVGNEFHTDGAPFAHLLYPLSGSHLGRLMTKRRLAASGTIYRQH